MSEPDHPPRPSAAGARTGRGWLDPRALAITGLVLALVPCCPMTGLAGAFLGVFALRRIRLAEGEPRGARLALAAIAAGVASAFVWSIALERFSRAQQEALREEVVVAVTAALEAAQDEDRDALRETWSFGADAPPAEEVTAFGRAALERYGRVERFAFISMARSGTILRPIIDVAGVGHFERGEPLVAARLELPMMTGRIEPVVRLRQLTIEDASGGDLTLGPSPEIEAAPIEEP